MAKEWSQLSTGFRSLRVTDPKLVRNFLYEQIIQTKQELRGEQYSTYRLQLPYKYSVPLIICSVFLHWILSNTIYLFVSQGGKHLNVGIFPNPYSSLTLMLSQGYYNKDTFYDGSKFQKDQAVSLPDDMVVAVGYSAWTLLALLITICLLICVPIVLSLSRLPGDIGNVGNSSIAISAACHVSPGATVAVEKPPNTLAPQNSRASTPQGSADSLPQNSNRLRSADDVDDEGSTLGGSQQTLQARNIVDDDGIEMERLLTSGSSINLRAQVSRGELTRNELLEKISQSKIRWGIIRMPDEFYKKYPSSQPYEHLGFGVEGEDILPPQYGQLYA